MVNPESEGIDPDIVAEINSIGTGDTEICEKPRNVSGKVWFFENNNSASYSQFSKALNRFLPDVQFKSFGNVANFRQELSGREIPDIVFIGDLYGLTEEESKEFLESIPKGIRIIQPNEYARNSMLAVDYVNLFRDTLGRREEPAKSDIAEEDYQGIKAA